MNKIEKYRIVLKAKQEVIEEYGSRAFRMFGIEQRLLLIQEKLPKVPMYGTHQIRKIITEDIEDLDD